MVTVIFPTVRELYQPLKAYLHTSAQVFGAILAFFSSLKDRGGHLKIFLMM